MGVCSNLCRMSVMQLKDLEFTEIYVSADGRLEMRSKGRVEEGGPDIAVDAAELAARLISELEQAEIDLIHDTIHYRATRIDAVGGVWWALRRQESKARKLKSLGLRSDVVRRLGQEAKDYGHGLVLIAGKTASGKTTTAGSILSHWLETVGDVGIALESPPEIPVRGRVGQGRCHQVKVEENGFAEAFGRAMRSTPRYILIGEIRYPEAAQLALRAAISGHLVIATIHAGSVQQALMSLIQVGQFEDLDQASTLLADGLLCVLHQTLVQQQQPRLEVSSLFVDSDSIRSKIRNRQFGQLKDDIIGQAARGV